MILLYLIVTYYRHLLYNGVSQVITPPTSNANHSAMDALAGERPNGNSPLPHPSALHILPQTLTKVSASNTPTTPVATSTASAVPTAKPASSASGTLSKGGASRVYKVVKRETLHPTKRERLRWISYDYVDSQTPHLGFVAHSASDTRLNLHDQVYHPSTTLPMSMSATSVPSSSSSFSLNHSDSSSSIYRDQHGMSMPTGTTMSAGVSVQQSGSTSSVNQDPDSRKFAKKCEHQIFFGKP